MTSGVAAAAPATHRFPPLFEVGTQAEEVEKLQIDPDLATGVWGLMPTESLLF